MTVTVWQPSTGIRSEQSGQIDPDAGWYLVVLYDGETRRCNCQSDRASGETDTGTRSALQPKPDRVSMHPKQPSRKKILPRSWTAPPSRTIASANNLDAALRMRGPATTSARLQVPCTPVLPRTPEWTPPSILSDVPDIGLIHIADTSVAAPPRLMTQPTHKRLEKASNPVNPTSCQTWSAPPKAVFS
jgi:hypothetical protein